jgi:hypothetical protein
MDEVKLDMRWVVIFLAGIVALIPGACGESVTVGCGSSVAVSEGSSAEGILASDGTVTQSSVSSVGVIDDLNIDPWVQNTNGDYAEIGVTGTNVAGLSYSDNYYPGKDQVGVSDAVWAQQWIGASSADSLHAYARASNSAGDNAGSNLDISYGSLKGYYNAAYAGPASWLGIDRGAFVQQTLDRAEASKIVAKTWAVDPAGDAAGALTDVSNGELKDYSVLAASAGYSNGLKAAGVSVDSMNASSPSGSIYQVMNTYNSKGDTSTVSLDKATSVTGYDGKAYAFDSTARATETGHVTGPFVGTANVGTATKTRTPNFGSEYDLSMSATAGTDPTGNLGYYVDPSMATSTLGAIQGAVNAAQSNDTINAAAGTYKENVVLDKSLTVNGAGQDKTTVDGGQKGSVFTIPSGVAATLADMTIQNGKASLVYVPSDPGESYYKKSSVGGGINNAGTLAVRDCAIIRNTVYAGTAMGREREPTIAYSAYGGGIYNSGTVTLIDSIVSENTANADNTSLESGENFLGAYGGGIYNSGAIAITGSTISGNNALADDPSPTSISGSVGGGGIYNGNTGTATIADSIISGNTAKAGSGGQAFAQGGGILGEGIETITNSIISGNRVVTEGQSPVLAAGGGLFSYGITTITGSTISGNAVDDGGSNFPGHGGGGINNWGKITITSCNISENTAVRGGGILNVGTAVIDPTTTITGNSEPQLVGV